MPPEMMQKILLEKVPPPIEELPPPPADHKILEGAWVGNQVTELRIVRDLNGDPVPLTSKARAILDRRVQANYAEGAPYGNAGAKCLPPGAPWQLGLLYPFRIFQTEGAVTFMFSEYHTVWNIDLENGGADAGSRPYMGNAVGHWDGDTLVIETGDYKLPLWIDADGSPASANAKISLRVRRIGEAGDQLEIITTIDDPEMYTRPWSFRRTYVWRPDMELFYEYDCERQLGGEDALQQYGLRPEPEDF